MAAAVVVVVVMAAVLLPCFDDRSASVCAVPVWDGVLDWTTCMDIISEKHVSDGGR